MDSVVSRLGTKGFLLAADGMHSEVRDFREAIENKSEASRHIGETLYNRLIRPLSMRSEARPASTNLAASHSALRAICCTPRRQTVSYRPL